MQRLLMETPVPLPHDWAHVHALLAEAQRSAAEPNIPNPPVPLILAGAAFSSANQIRRRWTDLVEWANTYGFVEILRAALPPPPDFDVADHFAGASEDGSGWWDDPYRLTELFDELRKGACPPSVFDPPIGWGVYAWFLNDAATLPGLPVSPNGVIYIGRSSDLADREIRQHLADGGTPSSTLRRSLGALLKEALGLSAIPRCKNPRVDRDFVQFSFTDDGERSLTAWMHDNLKVGAVVRDDPSDYEPLLIDKMKPVLNLVGWKNPYAAAIKAHRRLCSEEARSAPSSALQGR